GRELRRDRAIRLPFRDAGGKRGAPLGEDLGQPQAQALAEARRLDAEIADQTAARPPRFLQLHRDDIEVASQSVRRRERVVGEGGVHQPAHVVEVPVQDLARELLLRGEVVRERARPGSGRGDDVADTGLRVPGLPEQLQPCLKQLFTQRGSTHGQIIRTYVFPVKYEAAGARNGVQTLTIYGPLREIARAGGGLFPRWRSAIVM